MWSHCSWLQRCPCDYKLSKINNTRHGLHMLTERHGLQWRFLVSLVRLFLRHGADYNSLFNSNFIVDKRFSLKSFPYLRYHTYLTWTTLAFFFLLRSCMFRSIFWRHDSFLWDAILSELMECNWCDYLAWSKYSWLLMECNRISMCFYSCVIKI